MSHETPLSDGFPSWLQMSNDSPSADSQWPERKPGDLAGTEAPAKPGGFSQSEQTPLDVSGDDKTSIESRAPQSHAEGWDNAKATPLHTWTPEVPTTWKTSEASRERENRAPAGGESAVGESADEFGKPKADTSQAGCHRRQADFNLKPPPALDQSNLVNPVKRAPRKGWRKMLYSMTGGQVNVGDSPQELEEEALMEKIRMPLRGDYRIAVMSLKGGVGKTTTTVTLGGVFSTVRHDRVIAIDANPDLGTLAQRVAAPGPATIRDLLGAEDVSRYAAVRQYTTQAKSRLEVIGSERDPAVSEAFSESDYRHAIDILQHHYNVILTDCGTGLMHSAMAGVLDLANTLVLVTSPALDGAQSASATLDWLNLHGYEQLAANAVVVVSAAHPGNATIDMGQLLAHFRSRTRAVQVIPFDRHLSEGATIDLERVSKEALRAYHELAAVVAEDFDSWHRHASS